MDLKKYFLFFIIAFVYNGSFSQTTVINAYNTPTVIYSAKFEYNYIWIASSGGITKFDTVSHLSTFYNEFNSGLPTPNVFSVAIDHSNNKWFGTGGGPNGGNVEAVLSGAGLTKFDGTNWITYNTVNSGLPNNTVRSVFIDSLGIIWAGTYSGLAKFDGINWTVFNKINSGLPSDSITCITADTNGKMWIGTFHGIASYDGAVWNSYKHQNSGLPGDTIRTIAIDADNIKWIGTSREGLGKFDDTTWTTYNTSNSGLPYNNVTAILPESNGNIWFGTYGSTTVYGGGLTKFDGSSWTTFNDSNSGLPKNNVSVILADASGNKWLTSERGQRHGGGIGQINKFDETNWSTYSISNSGSLSNYCYHITLDGNNNLWFGGEKSGLTKYNGTSWTNYNSENSNIGDDDVLDIKFESNGDLWALHDGGKMSKFDGVNFNSVTSPGSNSPYCLYIDTDGSKWVGENGTGIYIWNDTVWTIINTANSGLPNDYVHAITIDSSGNKWIATYGGGVTMFDGVNWTVYNTTTSGLLTNNVNDVEVDKFQNKWIATQNGLAKFDGTNWIVYRTVNSGLPSNVVYSVAIDTNGVLWAGTSTGFAKFDGTVWTSFNYTTPAIMVFRHINFDNAGNVWVGTMGRGILKITDNSVTSYAEYFKSNIETLLNYPNPFSNETVIPLKKEIFAENFSVEVYDGFGRNVNCIYSVTRNPENSNIKIFSSGLENGIYYYKLIGNNQVETGKMIIQK